MAAEAAALLASRQDPGALLRAGRLEARRQQAIRAERVSALSPQPVIPTAATPDDQAVFRQAQHQARIKQSVGSTVAFTPAGSYGDLPLPYEEGSEDFVDEGAVGSGSRTANALYAAAQLGLDSRAGTAIRGELNNLKQKALDEASKVVVKKAKEMAKRWGISIAKNAAAGIEVVGWAAWMIEVVTYVYDCGRFVVTIFIPDPSPSGAQGSGSVGYVGKKVIRELVPPFTLIEPVGLIGFIFQTLMVIAIITIVAAVIILNIALIAGVFHIIGYTLPLLLFSQ